MRIEKITEMYKMLDFEKICSEKCFCCYKYKIRRLLYQNYLGESQSNKETLISTAIYFYKSQHI